MPFGERHGDLRAHGVADEHDLGCRDRAHEGCHRIRVPGEGDLGAGIGSCAVTREVDEEDAAVLSELDRKRAEVAGRDADAVHEHERGTRNGGARHARDGDRQTLVLLARRGEERAAEAAAARERHVSILVPRRHSGG